MRGEKAAMKSELDDARKMQKENSEKLAESVRDRKALGEQLQESRQELARLRAELERAQDSLAARQSEASHQKEIIESKNSLLSKLAALKDDLAHRLDLASDQLRAERESSENAGAELSSARQMLGEAKRQIAAMEQQLGESRRESDAAREELREARKAISEVKGELEDLKASNEESSLVNQKLKERLREEVDSREKAQSSLSEAKAKVDSLEHERESLKRQLQNAKQIASDKNVAISEAEIENHRLRDANGQLQTELALASEAKEKLSARLLESERRAKELQSQFASLSAELAEKSKTQFGSAERAELMHKLAAAERSLRDSKCTADSCEAQIGELRSTVRDLEGENQRLEALVFDREQKNGESEKIIQMLKLQNKELVEANAKLREDKLSLKAQLDSAEKQGEAEREALKEQLEASSQTSKRKLQEQLDFAVASEKHQREATNALQAERDLLKKELLKREREAASLEARVSQLSTRVSFIEGKNKELAEANASLQGSLVEQMQHANANEASVQKLAAENEDLLLAVERLRADLEWAGETGAQLGAAKSELEDLRAQSDRADGRIQELSRANHALEGENAALKESLDASERNLLRVSSSVAQIRAMLRPGDSAGEAGSLPANEQLMSELATLRDLVGSGHAQVDGLMAAKAAGEREIAEMKRVIIRMKRAIERQEMETATANARNEGLKEELKKIRELGAQQAEEREHLSASIEKLRGALKMTKAHLADSEREKNGLKEEMTRIQIQLDAFRSKKALFV